MARRAGAIDGCHQEVFSALNLITRLRDGSDVPGRRRDGGECLRPSMYSSISREERSTECRGVGGPRGQLRERDVGNFDGGRGARADGLGNALVDDDVSVLADRVVLRLRPLPGDSFQTGITTRTVMRATKMGSTRSSGAGVRWDWHHSRHRGRGLAPSGRARSRLWPLRDLALRSDGSGTIAGRAEGSGGGRCPHDARDVKNGSTAQEGEVMMPSRTVGVGRNQP